METPWKKGYWFTTSMSSSMGWMEENTFSWKSMIALDYPEAKPVMTCTVKIGEFGPAHPDVVKESGKDFYNMEMEMTGFKIPMVLSDDGTKICYIGMYMYNARIFYTLLYFLILFLTKEFQKYCLIRTY